MTLSPARICATDLFDYRWWELELQAYRHPGPHVRDGRGKVPDVFVAHPLEQQPVQRLPKRVCGFHTELDRRANVAIGLQAKGAIGAREQFASRKFD